MVILDTDHVSLLDRTEYAPGARLFGRLESLPADEIATTVISHEEQVRGWLAVLARTTSVAEQVSAYGKLCKQLDSYCAIHVLPFDERSAVQFQDLRRQKIRVGTMDMKIAAICLVNDATLLTRNSQDFMKIPGLKFEDWIKE